MTKASIKNVLVSQPKPELEKNSPFYELSIKYNIHFEYKKFFSLERLTVREFRDQKIPIHTYNNIIFNSRLAIDYYFSLIKELRYTQSSDTKYYCLNENIALYLQKYIQYRKRKIFAYNNNLEDLYAKMKKGDQEQVMLPCSTESNESLYTFLKEKNINVKLVPLYKAIPENLSNYTLQSFDMIVLFSPYGVKSLQHNFPNFKQNNIYIATFGEATAEVARNANLRVDIQVPNEQFSSMASAIENFILQLKKKKKS